MWNSRYLSLCCLIVSLFLQHVPATTAAGCDNRSAKWTDLGGDLCYIIETEDEVSWTDAVYRCFAEGGSLASFHSSEEVNRIVNHLKHQEGRLHIGLWKHNDGTVEWVDKSPFDFRNWERGEPTYREEKCVEFYSESGKWNDANCDRSLGYICASVKDQPSRDSTKVCPVASQKWSDFGSDLCYIIEANDAVTWDQALRLCSDEGGSLASFHSIEEVSVLLQHTKDYSETMHIGLQQNRDGKFQWADKSPFDLEFWDLGEPNDAIGELCGEMYPRSGQWNDTPCDKLVGYICSTPKVDAGVSSLETTQLPEAEICGGDIISDNGTIRSPRYPEKYGRNENCVWKITVPENYQISLHFQTIEVEYEADCQFDYIEVLDGHEAESRELRKICGSGVPQIFSSSGNKMTVKFVSDGLNEDTGFLAEFTKAELCGGDIVAEEGVLQTRNYPGNYGSNNVCAWRIRIPEGNKISLSFQAFETEASADCSYDYVEIVDGHEDDYSPILGKFCGSNVPSDVVSSGHKITVRFASDSVKEYQGFSAEFKKANATNIPAEAQTTESTSDNIGGDCDEDIVAERGILLSPNHPESYPPRARCTWRITVPDQYQVVLRFKTFLLEGSETCSYDHVDVYDGHSYNSRLLGSFCGSSNPGEISSSGNKMTVNFVTDSSGEYPGFAALFKKGHGRSPVTGYGYEETPLCGKSIASDEGLIQSPNYPENYRPNERCIWKITVPEDHQISLKFQSFQVETHDECNYDFVEVVNGHAPDSSAIAKLCGYDIPQDILSSGNKLMVTFKSDPTSEYSGFSAEFKKVVPEPSNTTEVEKAICGGDFAAESGSFSSPNYPENYGPLTECTWTITVEEGHLVVLLFEAFELEYGDNCEFDSLKVLDGIEPDSPLVDTFCNTRNPTGIRSSKNKITVKFVTDDSLERSGFSASFRTGNIYEETVSKEGVIQTRNFPSNYDPLEKCIWHIIVPEGEKIFLKFQAFELQYSSGCYMDFVRIFDGNSTSSNLRGTYCGSYFPDRVFSNGNQMTVEFTSDASDEYMGFSAEFKSDVCGGNLVSESGSISSSYYPESYRPYAFCIWNITVPEGNKVILQFETFSLESCSSCNCDSVEIYDGHEPDSLSLGRFCGSTLPDVIRSSTEKMSVRFKSDGSVEYSGFTAKFTKDVCGGDVFAESGIITSPNYPQNYGSNEACIWNITVPEDHVVVLRFHAFDLEMSDGCRSDYVEIIDGHDPDSSHLGTVCGSGPPAEIRSSTEKMSIRFASDGSEQRQGFSAEFAKDIPNDVQIVSVLQQLPSVFGKQKHRNPKLTHRPGHKKPRPSTVEEYLFEAMQRK